jgi:hypothetical protein
MFEIIIHLEQVTVRKWREMGLMNVQLLQMFSKTLPVRHYALDLY